MTNDLAKAYMPLPHKQDASCATVGIGASGYLAGECAFVHASRRFFHLLTFL